MKNTNRTTVEKVLNNFINYVEMMHTDQVSVPNWMNDLGHKIKNENKDAGKIYAGLRQGMMQEYGAQVAANILNNTFNH